MCGIYTRMTFRINRCCLDNFFRFACYDGGVTCLFLAAGKTAVFLHQPIMSSQQILVVDDDRSITKIVRAYLEQAGYRVLTAYNGTSAMQILRHERPDLLLLDLMLPDRDGWEITSTIRNDKRLAMTPIIMLTARVEDSDKIMGLELGADDYVTKPFNPREVVARVRALLRRHQLGHAEPINYLKVGGLQLDLGGRTLTF